MGAPQELRRGRDAYQRRAWQEAFDLLSRAEAQGPLPGADLERLANAAFLLNRNDDFLSAHERAHHAHVAEGDPARAARCAFWLALRLELTGQSAQASGWLSRAQHLVERVRRECVEQGYLLLPVAERHLAQGDGHAALTTAARAVRIGERFKDPELVACARHDQGRALLMNGEIAGGLALLDEAMVAATSGELSPVMTGLLYCSVIDACVQVHALPRAREWTAALAQWCEPQSQLAAFTGICRVHRSEVLMLQGEWADAMNEARRACERFEAGLEARPPAAAFYRQGEVHRVQGRFSEAEAAYREASRWGLEPQPGLALLRLAEGNVPAAKTSIRSALDATTDRMARARLLPVAIEIACAAGALDQARAEYRELEGITAGAASEALKAATAHAAGMIELADQNASGALAPLRTAFQAWNQLEAPYLAGRARALLARAYLALGDRENAGLERDAARAAFEPLGAGPDLDALAELDTAGRKSGGAGLTERELEVLKLVAKGRTSKAIAKELKISGKTVDRHLSNLFTKLDVTSRAAAVAHAYEQKLL